MKYSDIPSYTKTCSYRSTIELDCFEYILDRHIRQGLILEPDFQRGHVWTSTQQILYVEHLLSGGSSGKEIFFNCPYWHKGSREDFVCVDGLQRLMAIRRFLRNEIKVFGNYEKDFEGLISLDCCVFFQINDLTHRSEVLKWYLEMNKQGTPHTKEELARVLELYNKQVVNENFKR